MDPKVWQEQIDAWAQLGQFTKRTPKLDDVMTLDMLNAPGDTRPRSVDRMASSATALQPAPETAGGSRWNAAMSPSGS